MTSRNANLTCILWFKTTYVNYSSFPTIIKESITQYQAKIREASSFFLKSYSGKVKPPTMMGLSVGDLSAVGESLTKILCLFEVKTNKKIFTTTNYVLVEVIWLKNHLARLNIV